MANKCFVTRQKFQKDIRSHSIFKKCLNLCGNIKLRKQFVFLSKQWGIKLHNYANTMQLASFGISIWVNNSFNLSKYTYVKMYDNNVCQLNVCDMGAVRRFFKYGGRGNDKVFRCNMFCFWFSRNLEWGWRDCPPPLHPRFRRPCIWYGSLSLSNFSSESDNTFLCLFCSFWTLAA